MVLKFDVVIDVGEEDARFLTALHFSVECRTSTRQQSGIYTYTQFSVSRE
jgi:hypothetical protein